MTGPNRRAHRTLSTINVSLCRRKHEDVLHVAIKLVMYVNHNNYILSKAYYTWMCIQIMLTDRSVIPKAIWNIYKMRRNVSEIAFYFLLYFSFSQWNTTQGEFVSHYDLDLSEPEIQVSRSRSKISTSDPEITKPLNIRLRLKLKYSNYYKLFV